MKSENLILLLMIVALASCGPFQAELDAEATLTAASRFTTRTAAAATMTASIEPTAASTLLPLDRPPGPWLITPQVEVQGNLRVESVVDEDGWNVFLRISRGEDFTQEIDLSEIRFDKYPQKYFYLLGISAINDIILSDFESDDDPEIVISLQTPGANCCTIVTVLYFDKSLGEYVNSSALVNKWSLSPVLVDINDDGVEEIIRHNEDFYNSIGGDGSGAAISPIQIIAFLDGELIDVSEQFPGLIEEDVARIFKMITEHQDCTRILWSCYLSQMNVLGRLDEGWSLYEEMCSHQGDQY